MASAPGFSSIVVPTRNHVDDLRVCIDALLAQDYGPGFEVIVVDDGSTDGTGPYLASIAADHPVRVVTQPHRGTSAARNAGIAAARSDPVYFIDDDVAAPTGWLAAMTAGAARHPDADALVGRVLLRTEADVATCADHPLGPSLDLGGNDREVETGLGTNMAMRRRAIDLVGPFDEWIGAGQDTDWFDRLRTTGGRVTYIADAWVEHRRSIERARLPRLLRSEFRRGIETHRYAIRRGHRRLPWRTLRVTARLVRHAIGDRCLGGWGMAARSAGLAWGLARHPLVRPPE